MAEISNPPIVQPDYLNILCALKDLSLPRFLFFDYLKISATDILDSWGTIECLDEPLVGKSGSISHFVFNP